MSENGGVAILHSTQNNHRNYNFIMEKKMEQLTKSFNDFEMISLIEPHKWQQNSCTMLRKISKISAEEQLVRGRA